MSSIWKDNYDLNQLTKVIEDIRLSYDKGKVEFKEGYLLDEYLNVFLSALNFSKELPENDKYQILKNAVLKAAERKEISLKYITSELKKNEYKYFQKPTRYILVTNISVKNIPLIYRTKIDETKVFLQNVLPTKYSRSKYNEAIRKYIHGDLPKDYSYI